MQRECWGQLLQVAISGWSSRLSPWARSDHCAQESSPRQCQQTPLTLPATQGTARGHRAQPHQGVKRCCTTAAMLGQGRGTSSPVGWCQIGSALQSTSLPAWAFSEDTHTAAWTLPAQRALDCKHAHRYCTCCTHQLHSSEPAGY